MTGTLLYTWDSAAPVVLTIGAPYSIEPFNIERCKESFGCLANIHGSMDMDSNDNIGILERYVVTGGFDHPLL